MPCLVPSRDKETKRAEDFLNQFSLGSTATGTPLSRDAARYEASRSSSGSASRPTEAQVPKEGCDLLAEEEEEETDPEVADPQSTLQELQIKQPAGPSPKLEFRRRKYAALLGGEGVQVERLSNPVECESDGGGDDEVVIAGPLQQRFLGFWWRWRWCVLKGTVLHVYRDEGQWQADPTAYFEVLDAFDMVAVNESQHNRSAFFRCVHSETGSNMATFRGGEKEIWEEVAAMHLWVDLLNSARTAFMDVSPSTGLLSVA
mmetsp:Transcript_10288/g.24732  ORF Transcript_10288/g.24732 Transcript_10288/m.24732 type:complete len:259 (-) Transcript_10288:139-915(-)